MGISQLDIMLVYRRATTSVDMRAAGTAIPNALTQIITGSPAGKGSLEGSPFCLSALVNLASMSNIDHENDEPAVIDVAQDSVVTDPVSPHA